MPLVQHDHVIQTLASNRADQPFDVWILPGRSGCDEHFLDVHVLDALAEALARANFAMPLGQFEMNLSDGDLYHTLALLLVDTPPTEEQFHLAMIASMEHAANYHRAFARLVYGSDLSPAEVIAEVEMAADEKRRLCR